MHVWVKSVGILVLVLAEILQYFWIFSKGIKETKQDMN